MPRPDPGAFVPPPYALGADLCWWRETGDIHTLVSLLWERHAHCGASIRLELALFDAAGQLAGCCTLEPHAGQAIFIDSQAPPGALRDAPPVADGVLAIFACPREPPSDVLRARYQRLFSLIDWYSDDGLICSLHNDQSVIAQSSGHGFTEMVVEESDVHESYLVICNGPHAYPPASITLEVQNHRGERRRAVFDKPLRPFSANKIRIRELVAGAVVFADGRPLAIGGNHSARGLFIRPYVMTTGPFLSGYHGGDLYPEETTTPAHEHRFLDRGRVNLYRPGILGQ